MLPSDLMTVMWGGYKVANPLNITYSFVKPTFTGNVPLGNSGTIVAMTDPQKSVVRQALAEIAKVANVKFTEVASGTAIINYGMASVINGSGFTQTKINSSNHTITHASTVLDTETYNVTPRATSIHLMIHETMHAMANLNDIGPSTPHSAGFVNNSTATLMSFDHSNYIPTSPGIYDIAVLQNLYGKNTATGAGDSSYDLNTFSTQSPFTLWDAGGLDYLDASRITYNEPGGANRIDLNSGPNNMSFVYLASAPSIANFWIADGANIEGVIGSRRRDTIVGNDLNNALAGMGGDDDIQGGGGDDRINGGGTVGDGAGADTIDGGPGSDTVSYRTSPSAVTVNLATGVNTGGDAQRDVLLNVENITGSAFNDTITGDGNNNVLDGRNINGDSTDGNDTLYGGGGSDTLYGGYGSNTLSGGEGSDTLFGGTGTNNIHGDAGNDNINDSSSSGFIVLYGDEGDDVIVENGTGGGSAFGGNGNDILLAGASTSTRGMWLEGDTGVDHITGSGGADLIWGGAGDDVMFGGGGADAFYYSVVEGGNGNDTITDFHPGIDSFILADDLYFDGTVHSNGNTILTIFNDGAVDGTITVQGVTI